MNRATSVQRPGMALSLPASLFQTARTLNMKALKVAAKKPLQ